MEQAWILLRNKLLTLRAEAVEALPRMVVVLAVVLATWCVARLLRRAVPKLIAQRVSRQSLVDLIRQITYILTWIVGLVVAATIAFPSLTAGSLIGVLGLGSVAIGFAFKDIFENFFAGMLILWRFPFESDDVIECQGIQGRVEEVSVRMTLIRQLDGQLVAMPNAMLFKNPVTVRTALNKRRISMVCGIAYGEDVDRARDVIRAAVRECKSVDEAHDVDVLASDMSESSVDFLVRWWSDPIPGDERRSRDEVLSRVKRALDEAGIEIPFPYRTLVFKNDAPARLEQEVAAEE